MKRRYGFNWCWFDVDPTTATDFQYLGIPKLGYTHTNLKLKTASPGPIAVIIYAAFLGRVEIDDQCHVSMLGPKELLNELLQKTHSPPAWTLNSYGKH